MARITQAKAWANYISACLTTLRDVYGKPEVSPELAAWLVEVGVTAAYRRDLMQDIPLKAVAFFLGIDQTTDDFRPFIERNNVLYGPGHSP